MLVSVLARGQSGGEQAVSTESFQKAQKTKRAPGRGDSLQHSTKQAAAALLCSEDCKNTSSAVSKKQTGVIKCLPLTMAAADGDRETRRANRVAGFSQSPGSSEGGMKRQSLQAGTGCRGCP
eukprot:3621332-Amphidinium_carterae.1